MTMLTHPGRPFERAPHSSELRKPAETAAMDSRLAKIKQFCVCAFSVLLAMGALAGIIALKAAFFLSRLNFHH
jgi:hypothetical protein